MLGCMQLVWGGGGGHSAVVACMALCQGRAVVVRMALCQVI